MATVEVIEEVTEVKVIQKAGVILNLSPEEASAILTMICSGVGGGTVSMLGLTDVLAKLESAGVPRNRTVRFLAIAQAVGDGNEC